MSQPRVAYLVNQYPKVSHSFIRREILAMEALGVTVDRFAVRGWNDDVVDPLDLRERAATRYLLKDGVPHLLACLAERFVRSPAVAFRALGTAIRLSRGADRSLAHHLIYLAEASVLARELKACGAQHLHAHFGTNPAAVALLAHELGGPGYSFTVHGPEEFDKPAAIALARKIERARFVVAISSFGRSQLYRWIDLVHWPKVRVVHCGLEERAFPAATVAPPAQPRLVCVGRLCEQKGQLLLIEALNLLRQRGVTVELVLAGDGEMRAAIEARAKVLGVNHQIRITGWIDSDTVRAELLAARALVLPSFAEGLPVVIMESMAVGRPVISTYVAGIPELVQDGINGWLVAAGDVEALSVAMATAVACPIEQIAQMGEAARARVRQRHHIDTEVGKLLAHIQGSLPVAPSAEISSAARRHA